MSWLNTDAAFMSANQNNVALSRPFNDGTTSRTLTILEINETYIEYMFFLFIFFVCFDSFSVVNNPALVCMVSYRQIQLQTRGRKLGSLQHSQWCVFVCVCENPPAAPHDCNLSSPACQPS